MQTIVDVTDISMDELSASVSSALVLLSSNAQSRLKKHMLHPTVDALASLFAEGARCRATVETVAECLPKATPEAVHLITSAYSEALAELRARFDQMAMDDVRLSGVAWELCHSLGDRVAVPDAPTRSLPMITFRVNTTQGDVIFRCTAEQASDFLTELDAAVASTARLAKS